MTLKKEISETIESAIVSIDLHEVPIADYDSIADEVMQSIRNYVMGMNEEDVTRFYPGLTKVKLIQIVWAFLST